MFQLSIASFNRFDVLYIYRRYNKISSLCINFTIVQNLIPALEKRKSKDVGIDLRFHICIEHTIKYHVYIINK